MHPGFNHLCISGLKIRAAYMREANLLTNIQKQDSEKIFSTNATRNPECELSWIILWKSFLDCDLKNCLECKTRMRQRTHPPSEKWQQGRVKQVNEETLRGTTHSVLLHLFKVSTDLNHTHTHCLWSSPMTEENGPWGERRANVKHTCSRVYSIANQTGFQLVI